MKIQYAEITVEVKNLTDEQISSGNKIIADFMKTKRIGLNYHSNWSLIMPVVVKLQEKQAEITIYYKNTQIEWSDEDNGYDLVGVKSETKLLSIYNAVIKFLTWVKENEVDLDNPVFFE
jgi:hypothetical protein